MANAVAIPQGVSGLPNKGLTCYMNAVIQCLFHIDELCLDLVFETIKPNTITEKFAELCRLLWLDEMRSDIYEDFLSLVRRKQRDFAFGKENDAMEFLLFMLETLKEENASSKVMHQLFTGKQLNSLQCSICKQISEISKESFISLSVPIITTSRAREQKKTSVPRSSVSPRTQVASKQENAKQQTEIILGPIKTKYYRYYIDTRGCREYRDIGKRLDFPVNVRARMLYCELDDTGNFKKQFKKEEEIENHKVKTLYAIPMENDYRQIILIHQSKVNKVGESMKRISMPQIVKNIHTYTNLNSLKSEIMIGMTTIIPSLDNVRRDEIELTTTLVFSKKIEHMDDIKDCFRDSKSSVIFVRALWKEITFTSEDLNFEKFIIDIDTSGKNSYQNKEYNEPIEEDHHTLSSVTATSNEITLNECIKEWLKPSLIQQEKSTKKCTKCYKKLELMDNRQLLVLPDILIFQLTRFTESRWRKMATKDTRFVEFPVENLDMTNYLRNGKQSSYYDNVHESDNLYDLCGVINHTGSIEAGHYTAYVKNTADGHFYNFDDYRVNKIAKERVMTESAYILIYARKSLHQADNLHHWSHTLSDKTMHERRSHGFSNETTTMSNTGIDGYGDTGQLREQETTTSNLAKTNYWNESVQHPEAREHAETNYSRNGTNFHFSQYNSSTRGNGTNSTERPPWH